MPVSPFIELTLEEQVTLDELVYEVLQTGCSCQQLQLPIAPDLPGLQQKAASFVSMYVNGELRGCTGTCYATLPLWQDVCEHAYSSAFEDGRFSSLRAPELDDCRLIISVLSPMEPCENQGEQALLDNLRPGIDGLMIQEGTKRALFLPVVWGSLSHPKAFLNGLKRKGGWPETYWSEVIEIYRFDVVAQY